ncbi:hypothetical protein PUR59_00425 [Streptomyces sp. SP18ES09]|uniref:hypothetical protein n=1 Tax=Streptomyces sp. SP18ES09 TaxID=3002532 RepID=UPI002E76802E|nr:hypothetical protein [Streptomyces sp. SP18ES09]MEE1813516.1 hypothetical protein [Streptomyces sp. SP18ES09]
MNTSPSDALLDSPQVRDELAWAMQQTEGATDLPSQLGEYPLPFVAHLAHQRLQADTTSDRTPEETARLNDARALVKVILKSGNAHQQTRNSETPIDDWPALLAFTRQAVATRAKNPVNKPWARAAEYVIDRCDDELKNGRDNRDRAGAYGVLQHLATASGHGDGFNPAWTLNAVIPK